MSRLKKEYHSGEEEELDMAKIKEEYQSGEEEEFDMPKARKAYHRREEILQKKRERERERYARIKNDPEKLAAYREKDKQKYLKQRATGVRKTISEMTEYEKRQCRKAWRDKSSKYYRKKCASKKNIS